MTDTTTTAPASLEEAVADLVHCFTDASVWDGIAPNLTCGEVEALADVFRAAGHDDLADEWIKAHAVSDDEGDQHHGGDR